MKHKSLTTLVPAVEWVELPKRSRREEIVTTPHLGCHLTGWGNPAVGSDGEVIRSRWGGAAQLFVTHDDDGNGPRSGVDGRYSISEFAQGSLALAITDQRLLGSFREGKWALGGIDEQKQRKVLIFSWALGDVETVELVHQKKLLGGQKVAKAKVTAVGVPAVLSLLSAFPVNEKWDSAMVPKSDLPGIAAQLVAAAAPVWLATTTDDAERARLQQVQAGARVVEGNDEIAWLLDPES